MKAPLPLTDLIALVHRMRTLQKLRDETPGASKATRERAWQAEAEVDQALADAYASTGPDTIIQEVKP